MADKKVKAPVVPENDDRDLDQVMEDLEVAEDIGEQELDQRDQNLLEMIYSRFESFRERNYKYHQMAKEARQIVNMADPKQDDERTKAKNGKETLQLQTLKSTYNNVVADQVLSTPIVKLTPETPGMQKAADDLQDIVWYVMFTANNYSKINKRLSEDYFGPGTSILQVAWDPDMNWGRGEIALIRWPIEAFVWDPMAENIQDCRAVMKVSWHPLSWYRYHYPAAGRYVGGEESADNDVGMTEGQEDADHADDEDRAQLIEYWWREYDAETHRYKINVAYAAGRALLYVERDVYLHGMYPFVIDVHDSIEGSVAGIGLVSMLAPMMRYINRYAAYIDMNARMSSKGRMLKRKGCGIDTDALANWENDVIEGERIIQGEDWAWMQSAPFNGLVSQALEQMKMDLKQDSGANQFTRGETTGGIVSGKAINSLIQAGGKISSMRQFDRMDGVKDVAMMILWLVYQFWDEDRVVNVTGRKEPIKIDKEKLFGKKAEGAVEPPPYSVQIEISSKDPQVIASKNQMMMEAFTMAAQTNNPMRLSSLFRILNIEDKDRILPLIEEGEHYQEQMAAMQQQLEQAMQQLQAAQEENQHLRRATDEMANSLANTSARRNGGAPDFNPQESAIVEQTENNFGQQTGQALPV